MKSLVAVLGLALSVSLAVAQDTYTSGRINAAALFEKGMNALTGAGLSRSEIEAMKHFRAAADLGFAPAQVVMGYFAETGTLREPDRALDWYRKAAEQDDPLAQWLLGRLYWLRGDMVNAQKWLTSPADSGNPFAQYLLGRVMEDRDYTRAAEWFRKAAEQGLPQAQAKLGRLLRDGRGIKLDRVEAYVWLAVSHDAGYEGATPDLQLLEGQLGTIQVERAKEKARSLEESVSRNVVAGGCTGWPSEFDEVPAPPPPKLQRFCR